MFDNDEEENRPDYYADEDGKVYKKENKRGMSPLWLLPLLLIPIALFVWGGSKLLENEGKIGNVVIIPSPTPSGTQVGVGGAPDDKASSQGATTITPTKSATPTPKKTTPTPKKSPTATPKPTGKTEVGVGGAPEDPSVPSTPSTGHGW